MTADDDRVRRARRQRAQRMRERARWHPLRVAILDLLAGGEESTAADLCERLAPAESLSVVAYHLRVLQEAELVDRIGGLYRLPSR
jgi:DNA-binding transcriptional ArsR family regulator